MSLGEKAVHLKQWAGACLESPNAFMVGIVSTIRAYFQPDIVLQQTQLHVNYVISFPHRNIHTKKHANQSGYQYGYYRSYLSQKHERRKMVYKSPH